MTQRKWLLTTAFAAFIAPCSFAQAGSFEEALKSAYEQNPRIHAQRRTLEQSNEGVSQAIAAWRPTVSAGYQKGRARTRFDSDTWTYNDRENRTLSVNQPLFLGGSNFFNYFSAKDQMRAGRAQLQTVEQQVLLDAVSAYMDVIQNHAVLELSTNNEAVLGRQLDASRNRFEVGDVTRTDVAQSEARLSRAQSDRIQAKGNLESSIADFERVMGYRPENLPLSTPTDIPAVPATLDEALAFALENNPSLKSAHYQKESADDDIGVSAASLLPQVSLVGSMSRQDGTGVTGSSDSDDDALLLNVTLPIYQSGAEYSRVRAASLRAKQREFELEDTRDAVRESSIQAWENLETATATIKSQEQAVRAAEIALDGVRKEHQYGARTVLDVLDAEQELFISRVNLVRAQRNRMVSLYNLLLVLGQVTPTNLNLDTPAYDAEDHYDSVKWQLIGF